MSTSVAAMEAREEARMRVGVLTGGGDCPGLNAVIRAVVRTGAAEHGMEFIGFRDGWRGPLEGDTMVLDVHAVRGILPARRHDPGLVADQSAGRVQHRRTASRASSESRRTSTASAWTRSSRSAARTRSASPAGCTRPACKVVGVPKTIDNDLGGDRLHVRLRHRREHRHGGDRPAAHHRREPPPGADRRGDGQARRLDRAARRASPAART